MKGDSVIAVLLIFLIIAVVAALFVFSGGISGLGGFSGFFNVAQPVVYSNDVITVTDKFVADRAPYDGDATSIEFTVHNNGKGTAKGVQVALEPPTGFTSSVTVDGKACDKSACIFDIPESDAKDVIISLTAIQGVTQIIPVDVRYSVKYSYMGQREAHIPIVSNKNNLPKGQAFFAGDPTYGPIQLSVTPPDARPTADGGSAVYALNTIPIKVGFSVSDVGGGSGGAVKPVVMNGDDLKLTLTNLQISYCDKLDQSGILRIGSSSITPSSGGTQQPSSSGGSTTGGTSLGGSSGSSSSGTTTSGGSTTTTSSGAVPSGGVLTSFSTDKSSYSPSQNIIVTGSAGANQAVTFQLRDPTNGVKSINQVNAGSSGSFSGTLSIPANSVSGTYTVFVSSGGVSIQKSVSVGQGISNSGYSVPVQSSQVISFQEASAPTASDAQTPTTTAPSSVASSVFGPPGQKVPFDVSCTFIPMGSGDLTDGKMVFDYKYNYQISFVDTFDILPKNVPKIEAPVNQQGSAATSQATQGISTGGGGTGGNPTEIRLSTDQSSYSASQTIKIDGSLFPGVSDASVVGEILRPNNDCCEHVFQVITDSSGAFTHTFTLPSNPDKGTWTIHLTYKNLVADKTVTIT